MAMQTLNESLIEDILVTSKMQILTKLGKNSTCRLMEFFSIVLTSEDDSSSKLLIFAIKSSLRFFCCCFFVCVFFANTNNLTVDRILSLTSHINCIVAPFVVYLMACAFIRS